MVVTQIISPNEIRAMFSDAMSEMYGKEVPLYKDLISLVTNVNSESLINTSDAEITYGTLSRITAERHGAIRLGTATELATMARLFAVMDMYPVDYYDLSINGLPVHSTAFRPIDKQSLSINPFRVFTSLLRIDLLQDNIRKQAETILSKRQIFNKTVLEIIEKHEKNSGLTKEESEKFVAASLETFKWHKEANIDSELYNELLLINSLVADIVGFKGPHINHLTPRTLNIDLVHQTMIDRDIITIPVIQGPPQRNIEILLRQTSFVALNEDTIFSNGTKGKHRARFGEIEQRGVALTPKGRNLYDKLLTKTEVATKKLQGESYKKEYTKILRDMFSEFPDTLEELYDQNLAYFIYRVTDKGRQLATIPIISHSLNDLIQQNIIEIQPIIYEDFLPVSAAGIFKSNLDDRSGNLATTSSNKAEFLKAINCRIYNQFELYENESKNSLCECSKILNIVFL